MKKFAAIAVVIGVLCALLSLTNTSPTAPTSTTQGKVQPAREASWSEQSAIQAVVKENLNDPSSAQFGEAIVSGDGRRACIEWNAKNGFGGYGGQKIAQMRNEGDGWNAEEMDGKSYNCNTMDFALLDVRGDADLESEIRLNRPGIAGGHSV